MSDDGKAKERGELGGALREGGDGLRAIAARLLVPLALLAAPGAGAQELRYDGYIAGVHVAELRTGLPGGACAIRKKDFAADRWRAERVAPGCRIAGDTAFALWGAVADLPARLPELRAVSWGSLRAVGWPDERSIYVPRDTLRATVGARAVVARRWARRDATRPMDLVVAGGEVVAGFDVAADIVLVRRGYEGFTTVARWREPGVSQPRGGFRALEQAMVPMRDGVRLATLVYLPDGPGPFPTVFIRTPYGIGGLIHGHWPHVARGYALVVQAVRGTSSAEPAHRSEGVWGYFRNEAPDGADALAWVARQPWSDGQVCMQGGSYLGYTQWTAAMSGNPALKCIIPEVSMGTMFSDQPYWGGGFVEGVAFYLLSMLDKPLLPGRTWNQVLHHRPLIDIDVFATGEEIPQWNALLEHTRNDEYWRMQDWYAAALPPGLASLHISGWFDDDFAGTESNWALVRSREAGPRRLLVGPWKHGYNRDRMLNGFAFGETAVRDDILLLKQRWFDRFLKGMANGVETPRVEYFVLGENAWRTATDWPPPESAPRSWYLRAGAAGLPGAGALAEEAPRGAEPFDEYRYDPARPPTNWMSFDLMERWEDQQTWPYDFKDIEARPDVVVYTTPPLVEDLTIAGDVRLVLHASTDARDTDWWIHLSDVHPDDRSVRLTTGVLRARFRDREDRQRGALGANYRTETPLSGDLGQVVRYEIGLRSVANTFRRGHRIRIAVMNALDNYEFPNTNAGGDEARETRMVVATMRIHHSADHPSRIELPVLRAERAENDQRR